MRKTSDHVTREILRAARRGEIGEAELADLLRAHLEEICPECRRESEAERATEIPVHDYAAPVRRARYSRLLRAETERVHLEMRDAPRLLRTLQDRSVEQRWLRIRNAPDLYGSNRFLCELLFDIARSCLPGDPAGSQGWAETIEAIARLRDEPYMPHVVRALAFQGNARRAAGDFDSAIVHLHRARSLLVEHEVHDLELSAELHSFLGSLCTDLRRFEQAAEHLENASRLCQVLNDDEGTARVLMQLGNLHREQGAIEQALEVDRAAVDLLSADLHPRLYLSARLNHALNLLLAGRPQAAREVLVYDELHFQDADEHVRLRVQWLEGRIDTARGELEGAESTLLTVRDRFVEKQHGFNCALVCLDLALLYHRQTRWRELRAISAQAVQLFQSYALHQEALAALVLLREAAAAEDVAAETIERVVAFLHTAQRDPKARFQPTS